MSAGYGARAAPALGVGVAGLIVAALLWGVLATAAHLALPGLGLLDNGDGHRVLDKAFVARGTLGAGVAPERVYPMAPIAEIEPRRLVPDSLSSLIALVSGTAAKLAGQAEVWLGALPFLYHGVYAAGALMLIAAVPGQAGRVAAAAVLAGVLVSPLTLGLFGSYYEEAAVIAGMPLWTALALGAQRGRGRAALLALATAALVYAKPAALLYVAPALALIWGAPALRGGRFRMALTVLLIAVCLAGLTRNAFRYGDFNGFNRLHNGLAYTLAEVSDWDARHFVDRLEEAAARVDPAEAERLGLASEVVERWGQSYWPGLHGVDWPTRMRLAEYGSLPAYLGVIARAPDTLPRLIVEPCLTALRADYRLDYLRRQPMEGWLGALHARLGWLFAALGLGLAAAAVTGRWRAAVLLLPPVAAPVLVALADGYYEYEKHLVPYLMTGAIAAIGAAVLAVRRRGTEPP